MTENRVLYAYLTILTGNRSGTNFPLDPARENVIGRGTDCHISIPDPISSREHAMVSRRDDAWLIRDAQSRNGTSVNLPACRAPSR
jgi:two-component system, NtrC family, response regulator HydG